MTRLIQLFLALTVAISTHIDATPQAYDLTRQQVAAFQRHGVLVIRGLLTGPQLQQAIQAAIRVERSTSLVQRLFYRLFPNYRSLEFQTWRQHQAFARVAFDSAAPTICAQLMGLDPRRPRTLRLLKDAVLGFRPGDSGCGWHVDDRTFWPCEDARIGKPDAGINVWITLSPVTAAQGGGLAVAPGTHHPSRWTTRARQAIKSRGQMTTCHLQTLEPDCHAYMERLKTVYDLQPGDAIFHNRYIFHRGDPFVDEAAKPHGWWRRQTNVVKHRISLRYVTDDTTFYNDHNRERAVQAKCMDTGDAIAKGGEYYPQTWPRALPEERNRKPEPEKALFSYAMLFRVLKTKLAKTKKQ